MTPTRNLEDELFEDTIEKEIELIFQTTPGVIKIYLESEPTESDMNKSFFLSFKEKEVERINDSKARFSHDGKKYICSYKDNLYLRDKEGNDEEITRNIRFFSPSPYEPLIVINTLDDKIKIINYEGKDIVETVGYTEKPEEIIWSPDKENIFFSERFQGVKEEIKKISKYDLKKREKEVLKEIRGESFFEQFLIFGASKRKIFYDTESEDPSKTYAINLESRKIERLNFRLETSKKGYFNNRAISPLGDKIIISNNYESKVYSLTEKRLISKSTKEFSESIRFQWAPNNNMLAGYNPNNKSLKIFSPQGEILTSYTLDEEYSPYNINNIQWNPATK